MTKLTRRSVLTGAAAAGAAAAHPFTVTTPVRAAAPLAGKQAPGFYRYKVGDLELTQVCDGARTIPVPDGFVKNVGKDQVLAAVEAPYLPKGHMTIPFNPLVVNTGAKLVLIDTGWGPETYTRTGGKEGQLLTNLAAAGIDPKTIDVVLISHMHPDHANGIKAADGTMVFPSAEIMVPSADWAFWMNDEHMSKAQGVIKGHFENNRKVFAGLADKVTRYEAGREVVPGITAIAAPGHTPGHVAFAVASGGARVIVQGDVTNIPALFLRNPDWHVLFDVDPVKAAETRRKFHDMAVAEKALVAGFHFPFPALAHIEKSETGYREIPIPWNPTI